MYACPLSSIGAVVVICCGEGLVVGWWRRWDVFGGWEGGSRTQTRKTRHVVVFSVCGSRRYTPNKKMCHGGCILVFGVWGKGGGYARTQKTRPHVAFFVFWWVSEAIGPAEHDKHAIEGMFVVLGRWERGCAGCRLKES